MEAFLKFYVYELFLTTWNTYSNRCLCPVTWNVSLYWEKYTRTRMNHTVCCENMKENRSLWENAHRIAWEKYAHGLLQRSMYKWTLLAISLSLTSAIDKTLKANVKTSLQPSTSLYLPDSKWYIKFRSENTHINQ